MHHPCRLVPGLFALLLAVAGSAQTTDTARGRQVIVPLGKAGDILSRLFGEGVKLQGQGRYVEAETRFRSIVSVDRKDWEAQERLVQVLQGQQRKAERDARIEVLRGLHRSGLGWRPYFCRDIFVMGSKRVQALEFLERDEAGRKRILFLLSDLLNPGPMQSISVLRSREIVRSVPSLAETGAGRTITGYELMIMGLERPRTYFVPFRKPEYSDMKGVLAEIISGA